MKESPLQHDIRLALMKTDGCAFWRNNVGLATFKDDRTGEVRTVRFGLFKGSSDNIGLVGERFCALETKTETGRLSPEQKMFLDLVRRLGGYADVVRSVEQALEAVERCKCGEQGTNYQPGALLRSKGQACSNK